LSLLVVAQVVLLLLQVTMQRVVALVASFTLQISTCPAALLSQSQSVQLGQ
jgi:hypothetical protein